MCFFKLTMKAQAPKAMVEPFDINSMIKLWVKISNNGLFTQQLSKQLKLVEIVVMSMLKFVEDEKTFSTLGFKNDKLRNWLGQVNIWTQLFTCLHKSFILKITSLIKRLLQLGRIRKFRLVSLNMFVLFKTQASSIHLFTMWTSLVNRDYVWFLMRL